MTAHGCLPPLVTAVGGFAAQEAIISLTGKFTPLHQWVREEGRRYMFSCHFLSTHPFTCIHCTAVISRCSRVAGWTGEV